jgi:predicted RNase H-like HicB family nuclease|tara:strand:- start:980 stop:1723 length:744 start_codon:yes stop_codon:yes gene_type:complete
VQRILVRTDDFQLAYRIMQILRTRKINVEQYSLSQPLPKKDSIWIGSVDEVAENLADGRPIAAELDSIDIAIEAAIFALKGSSKTHRFTLGIDTGPRPGLAWFTDGILIDTKQTESVEECIEMIESLIENHDFEHLLIRMGKGSPSHRNRLVNAMLHRGYVVELVNERKTSSGLSRNQHGVSAIRIATLAGERVWEAFDLQPTEGEIREIQRRSRIKSQGRITISSDLAKKVVIGELTLAEAIEQFI